MKVARLIALVLIVAGIVFFVPPKNELIIFAFITLLSLTISSFFQLFLSKKYLFLIFLASFISLSLLVLDLFDIINLILTFSLILGIFLLIK